MSARPGNRGSGRIAGVDEVGRGALFGPVFAAAVILSPDRPIRGLRDSKQLDPERREVLAGRIRERAVAWAVAAADAFEIDRINIYQASRLAMRRAVQRLNPTPDYLLMDAVNIDLPLAQRALIHGDALSQCIAAASILAKVERDACMREWDQRLPAIRPEEPQGLLHRRALEGARDAWADLAASLQLLARPRAFLRCSMDRLSAPAGPVCRRCSRLPTRCRPNGRMRSQLRMTSQLTLVRYRPGMRPRGTTEMQPAHPQAPVEEFYKPLRPAWPRKLAILLFIIVCFEVGVFLVLFPWMRYWRNNSIATLAPWLLPVWDSPFFRGALSGLGVVNLYISIAEVVRLRRPPADRLKVSVL